MKGVIYTIQSQVRDSERLSLNEFTVQLRERLDQFKIAYTEGIRALKRLRVSTDVWPDQCQRASRALVGIEGALQSISVLLGAANTLPFAVVMLRYDQVVTVNFLLSQLQQLDEELREFQRNCRSGSQRAARQRQSVQRRLSEIIPQIEDAETELLALLDRSRFRELAI
jgi:hypothetical protein